MRSPLTRPEAALAGLAGLVLVAGSVSALALAGEDDPGTTATAPSTRSAPPPSASPRASASAIPPASLPQTQQSPAGQGAPPPPDQAAPPAAPEQRPPEQVAVAFFDAAVQGRDADALAVAEAQALSDLREYEAWESHRLSACQPEKGHAVCVFEAETTFLRLVLGEDAATGWRVLAIE